MSINFLIFNVGRGFVAIRALFILNKLIMEIKVEIVSVDTLYNKSNTCLLIGGTIINMFGEIQEDVVSVTPLGKIIAGNKYSDVGLSPIDIINLARHLGLEIP